MHQKARKSATHVAPSHVRRAKAGDKNVEATPLAYLNALELENKVPVESQNGDHHVDFAPIVRAFLSRYAKDCWPPGRCISTRSRDMQEIKFVWLFTTSH